MSVRFILGRSGSGKTGYCTKAIVQALLDDTDNRPLILLVPEQATYQAERAILSDDRLKGYHRLSVLSFNRMQFMLLGKNNAKSNLSKTGRQMIVQRLLYENKDNLQVFGSASQRTGTAAAIAQTIAELHQYGSPKDSLRRSAEEIDDLAETLKKYDGDSLTSLKFGDIALIYRQYVTAVRGSFVDTDMQLNLTTKAVAGSPLVKNARLWVDGFAGFTSSELAVLAELLQTSSEANIALCLDAEKIDLKNANPGGIDPTSLFGPTEVTYCDLLEIIKKRKLKLVEPVILTKALRFENCTPLEHIEKEIFVVKPEKTSADDSIKVAGLPNARSEVRFIAREILKLVKEKKYRYRDIAVITSDIDYYEHYLRAYLEDFGVPYFIDKRQTLSQHPAVILICSAIAIAAEGFSQSEVFAYLKTGLTGVDFYDIDALENYCVAYGVRDGDWQSDAKWDFAAEQDGFDNEKIDRVRRAIAAPLVKLSEKLKPNHKLKAADFTKAVFAFLDELSVRQRLNKIVETVIAAGDTQKANLHQQFIESLCNIFDEMVEAFAEVEFSAGQFAEVIKNAFSQMTLAFIPPRLDQVLVGSIERSRHPDLKAVFLLGCTDRQFPVPVTFDSVITETDRQMVKQNDFRLGPGLSDQLCRRQYLAYIAFTRPARNLYLTFPLVDAKGAAVVHSRFIDRLTGLFTDLEIETISADSLEPEKVSSEHELIDLLCAQLGADSTADPAERQKLQGLLNSMKKEQQLSISAANIEDAIQYDNQAHLERTLAGKLYGNSIRVSATRLNSIASCPYQYFAKYILKLTERKESKFKPLDKGQFYHKVLEYLFKNLKQNKIDITALQPSELKRLVGEQIDRLLKDDVFISHFFNHSKHNAYIIASAAQSLDDFVPALADMIKAGQFRPALAELNFGDKESELGECIIQMPDGKKLTLNGKIDRLDTALVDGAKLAVVFDYKLSSRPFSFSKFYYGLDLQLPIYLLAVRNGKKSDYEPIGGFFVPVESSAKSTEYEKIENQAGKFSYKAKGIFNGKYAVQIDNITDNGWSGFYNFCITKKDSQYGRYSQSGALKEDHFEKVMEFAQEKITGLVHQILKGRIEVSPYRLNTETPCKWCKYLPVCRFDWRINDYRILQIKGKKDVLGDEGVSNE
ncbi:MAG: exodeoxyribonuclease V subunit gamma [Sedimentisphaerales bacterium]|nr:exodeoxyribonuclease V subunit gamma [Sedimentisphaerales bacterium]